jgi:hypothetical protein
VGAVDPVDPVDLVDLVDRLLAHRRPQMPALVAGPEDLVVDQVDQVADREVLAEVVPQLFL